MGTYIFFFNGHIAFLKRVEVLVIRKRGKWTMGMTQYLPGAPKQRSVGHGCQESFVFCLLIQVGRLDFFLNSCRHESWGPSNQGETMR